MENFLEQTLAPVENVQNDNPIFNGNQVLEDVQNTSMASPIDASGMTQTDPKPIKFVPTSERLNRFGAYVMGIERLKRENATDSMRKANIINAISEISPDVADVAKIDPDAALSIFFGAEDAKNIDKMESFLTKAEDINSYEQWEYERFTIWMDEDRRRDFIEDLYKPRLEIHKKKDNSAYGFGGSKVEMTLPKKEESVPTGKYRKMTDEEYQKWSKEFLDSRNYGAFWNTANNIGLENMRLAFALSMAKDDGDVKAYLPELEKLTKEQRAGVYWAAHEFMPENSYWQSISDKLIDGASDAVKWVVDVLNGKKFKTTPTKFAEYIDDNGGWDAIQANPKTVKSYFSQIKDSNFVDESGFEHSGISHSLLRSSSFYASDDNDMLDKAKAIYEVGKKQVETKNILRDIQKATEPKYASEGYVVDRIIDGLYVSAEVGQFLLPWMPFKVASSVARVASAISKSASASKKVASAERAIKLAERAKNLAKFSNRTNDIAGYLSHTNKLIMPYFWARMANDLAEQAHEAGLTEEESFVVGAVGGFVNSMLEKLQFNLYMKNPLLGEKVINAIVNKKGWFRTITTKYAINAIKNRAATFGQEFLIENAQNFNEVLALHIGALLTDEQAKDFNLELQRLGQEAKDLIIPLITSTTLLGSSRAQNQGGYLQNVARAREFAKAPELMYRYQGAVLFQQAQEKMDLSGLPTLSIEDAVAYNKAKTQQEKDDILSKVDAKQRPVAEKVLTDVSKDLVEATNKSVEAVKSELKTVKLQEAPVDINHKANTDFIKSFIDVLGIKDEVVYLEKASSDPTIEQAIIKNLEQKGYKQEEIERLQKGELIEGMRYDGKIYLFGDALKTPMRTLEVLKHEAGHRGAESIRQDEGFKKILVNLLDSAGGESIVREAMAQSKGIKNAGDRYELAEEYMCILAEKVRGQDQLSNEEKNTWAKIVNFFSEIISDLPRQPFYRDRKIANIIRAIWAREYFQEPPEEFDFDEEGNWATLEQEQNLSTKTENDTKEVSQARKQKAKKDFRRKIAKRKIDLKKLSVEQRARELKKQDIADWINFIPDEDVSAKLEAISSIDDEDLIATDILQWGAEQGDSYCKRLLEERLKDEEKKSLNDDSQSLLEVMRASGLKLPTPKAIINYARENNLSLSSFLSGEIKDLYMSLSFGQRQQFFTSKYTSLDEIAQILTNEHGFNYEGEADFISDFAENIWNKKDTRFSIADRKFDAESKRQYDQVVARYKDTPQWMKAPNGKPTKLTEEQWVMVRTPNFKKWFGDWEKKAWAEEAIKFLESTPAVATLTGKEFQKDGVKLTEKVPEYFKSIGGIARNAELGDVVLDLKSIKSSMAHGISSLKASAFMAVKDVIENGFIFNREINWKDRGYNTAVMVAPIKIGADDYICEVIVKKTKDKTRFYVHGVEIKKTLDDMLKTTTNGAIPQASKLIIGKHLAEVKDNVSKVVDDNGEPLVVYHGTDAEFTAFDTAFENNGKMLGDGFYLTNSKNKADNYGNKRMQLYANIKVPFVLNERNALDEIGRKFEISKEDIQDWLRYYGGNKQQVINRIFREYNLTNKLKEKGYDGVIYNYGSEIVAFEPNQIKSATDNVGTFDNANDDIRFSFVETRSQEELDAINAKFRDWYEQYNNGDQDAYNQAVELVKEEAEIESAINEADVEIDKEHQLAVDETNSRIENAKKKFIQDNLNDNNYNADDDDADMLEFYEAEEDEEEVGSPVRIYYGQYYGGNIVEFNKDGKSTFVTYDNTDSANRLYKYDSLEEAKIDQLKDAWEENFTGEDSWEYMDSVYENDETNILQRKFVRAMEKLGIKVNHKEIARTGSEYVYIETPSGEDMKIRIADHPVVYSADVSIEQGDWKGAVRYVASVYNDWHEDYNDGETIRFSFADNDIHDRKRMHAIELAKKLYSRLGNDWDESQPMKISEYPSPTQDDKADIAYREMDFLDEDIQFVADRAEAILAKMIAKSDKRNLLDAVPEFELDFERQQVYDKIVEEAIKDFQKSLNLRERVKKQAENNLKKFSKAKHGFSLDELAINGIDLAEAIAGFNKEEIEKTIDDIAQYCKKWASAENTSYDIAFAKIKASFTRAFNDFATQIVYGSHIKSATKAISTLADIQSEVALIKKAKVIAKNFAKFLKRETEDFAKAKKAKEQKRIKTLHDKAVKLFVNFAEGQKLPDSNKLDIKRKLPARVQAYLAQIKKVIKLDADEVKNRYEELSKRKTDLEKNEKDLDYKERYELSALMIFGNIEEKSLAEILSAYDQLKKFIQGEKDKQLENLEKWEAEIAEVAEPLIASLKTAGYKKLDEDSLLWGGAKRNDAILENRLRNIFVARKINKNLKTKVEGIVKKFSTDIARAAIFERNFYESEMQWLTQTLEKLYGSADNGFERLNRSDQKLSKFASVEGRQMSIGQIIQIVCTLEQWQVKEAYKQAKQRLDKSAGNLAKEPSDKYIERFHYWDFLFNHEEEMRSLLSDADNELIEALKLRYAERFDKINPIYEKLNGLPMISNGINYMPIVRLGEFNLDDGGENVIRIFPSYYTPRTISLKELDEDVNVLQLFVDRTQTDAHFINFADIIFETKELFANEQFGSVLLNNLSRGERQGLENAIRDTLKGRVKAVSTADDRLASFMAKISAYAGLAYNITSAMKQPTSAPAFLLKMPAIDYYGGLKDLIAEGQFLNVVKEIATSPLIKDRRDSGMINQIMADFERTERKQKGKSNTNVLRRVFKKFAFMPMKYADSLGFIVGGASVYYHFYKQYREIYPVEEAKRLAMADMIDIGEKTQQSGFIQNMSESQRQGGGIGKLFTLFRTTNQQFLSFEINAITEAMADPSSENIKRLGKTLLLNHAILPALFNGMGLVLNLAMGDDFDDEDWEDFLKSSAINGFLDVFTGWWVGAILKGFAQMIFLKGNYNLTDSMLSAGTPARVFSALAWAIRDYDKNGLSGLDWAKHIDRTLSSLLAPYRMASKIYKNATDDKEGFIW